MKLNELPILGTFSRHFLSKKKHKMLSACCLVLIGFLTLLVFDKVNAKLLLLTMFIAISLQSMLGIYNKAHCISRNVYVANHDKNLESKSKYLLGLSIVPFLYGLTGWIILIPLLLWLVIVTYKLACMALRVFHKNKYENINLDIISKYSPKVAVHVSGSDGVEYQIKQWLPVLTRLNMNVLVIARQWSIIEHIKGENLITVYARNAADVEKVLDTGIKTVLYPANPMKNLQLLRHFKINHYFINHGESDKEVNQSKLLLAYDKLLLSGPLAKYRLERAGLKIRKDQVVYTGRPQAEILLNKQDENKSIKVILYAPTWEGFKEHANYSSLGESMIEQLRALAKIKTFKLIFKPHPYTGLRSNKYKKYVSRISDICINNNWSVHNDSTDLFDLMNQSDLLIADISSVTTDYLVTEKPFIVCLNRRFQKEENIDDYPSVRASYILEPQKQRITELINDINSNDSKKNERNKIRKYILGGFSGSAFNQFKNIIYESISK